MVKTSRMVWPFDRSRGREGGSFIWSTKRSIAGTRHFLHATLGGAGMIRRLCRKSANRGRPAAKVAKIREPSGSLLFTALPAHAGSTRFRESRRGPEKELEGSPADERIAAKSR